MADNVIKVGVQITDGGSLSKVESSAKDVNTQLKNISSNAATANKALNNIKSSTILPKAASTAAKQSESTNDMLDYKVTRGITGATGAAGRDFAKQSQGLGGLVHVYATFAANIFAVSAAFTALKNAADTTNMIKGLDQLGAASGRALGSLSKTVVRLTDGAVSLREAMTSVAQASAAGMSGENIERLAVSAQKVSAALGLSVPDALSRLSRGISKIEPELLDELGIFVKVDQASRDYARSIGKTASALTDFEKRQGFANAVLDQAESKFSKIEVAANPYSKLLASLQNMLQSGLELVNKVIGPLANFLATSPVALIAGLTAIVGLLGKMALPAVGNIKENSKAAAEVAKNKANLRNAETRGTIEYAKAIAESNARLQEHTDKLDALEEAYKKSNTAKSKSKLFSKAAEQFTPDDWKKLASNRAVAEAKGNIELVKSYDALEKGTRAYLAEAEKRGALDEKAIELSQKKGSVWSAEGRIQLAANKANLAAISSEISARTAQIATERGFFAAVKHGWAEAAKAAKEGKEIISQVPLPAGADGKPQLDADGKQKMLTISQMGPKMDMVTASISKVKTVAVAATVSIGGIVNALGTWMAALGLVFAAFSIFDSWVTRNTKQMQAVTDSLTTAESALDGLNNTIENITSQDSDKWLSAKSMDARAISISEVTKSLSTLIKKLKDSEDTSNWWTNFTQGFWRVFGKDDVTKVGNQVKKSIDEILKNAVPSEALSKLKADLDVIKSNGGSDEEVLQGTVRAINEYSAAITKASEVTKAFEASLDSNTKLMADITNNITPTDSVSKFAIGVTKAGYELQRLSENSAEFVQAFATMNDAQLVALNLGEKRTAAIGAERDEYKKLTSESQGYAKAIDQVRKEQKKLTDLKAKQGPTGEYQSASGLFMDKQSAELKNARLDNLAKQYEPAITKLTELKAGTDAAIGQASEKLKGLIGISKEGNLLITNGLLLFAEKMSVTLAQAGLAVKAAANSALTGGAASTAQLDLVKQEVALQIRSNNLMAELTFAQHKNTVALERDTTSRLLDSSREQAKADDTATRKLPEATRRDLDDKIVRLSRSLEATTKVLDELGANKENFMSNVAKNGTPLEANSSQFFAQSNNSLANQAVLMKIVAAEITDKLKQVDEEYKKIYADMDQTAKLDSTKLKNLQDAAVATRDIGVQEEANLLSKKMGEEALKKLKEEQNQLIKKANIMLKAGVDTRLIENYLSDEDKLIRNKEKAQQSANVESEKAGGIAAINIKYAKEEYDLKKDMESFTRDSASRMAANSIKQSELEILKELNALDGSRYLNAKLLLDQEALKLKLAADLYAITNKSSEDRSAANKAYDTTTQGVSDPKVLSAAYILRRDILKEIADAETSATNIAKQSSTEELRKLEIVGKHKTLLEQQKETMEDMINLTETLGGVFGKVGSAIGKTATSVLKMGQNEVLYLNKKAALQKKLDNTDNRDDERLAIAREIMELDKKQTIQTLNNQAEIASQAKQMFSEKTGMYKALNAIEQANHAAAMVMQAEKMATELANLPTTLAGGISKLFEQGGWAGFAGAAALIAMIGSLAGGVSGGSVSMPALGATAAEQQEVQGTGMAWKNGAKVETGYGKLGDPTALSTAIADSLDIVANNSFESLDLNNRMVYLLTKISNGINRVSTDIYAVAGIRTGSQFGTKEGNSSSSILGGLWGKSTSAEIINAGLRITGTFKTVAANTEGMAKYFETVRTTTQKSILWIKTKPKVTDSTTERVLETTDKVSRGIAKVFEMAGETFEIMGDRLGMTSEQVFSILNNIPVDLEASLRGLSGEDAAKALEAALGIQLDKAAEALFPAIIELQRMGEDLYTTATRLTKQFDDVNFALDSIGKTKLSKGIDNVKVANTISEMPGGMDAFISNTKAFGDAFLTEAERLAPIQRAVTTRMTEMGFGAVTTRDQFKQLVLGFPVVDEATATTYANLLELVPAFDLVTKEADTTSKALSAEELAQAKRAQDIELMTAKGYEYTAMLMSREDKYAELMKQDPTGGLTSGQKAVDAQNDVNKTRDLETALLTAQGKTLQVVAIQREKELNKLSETDQIIQKNIYAQEDLNKTNSLSIAVLEALGMSSEALNLKRAQELAALSETDRALQSIIYAEQDAAKTRNLEISLMEASGNAAGALVARRTLELRSMSASDRELQKRIWALQDEAKITEAKFTQEQKIYTLLGNSAAALQMTRDKELASLDESLRPRQRYIYALEDEATLKDKLIAAYNKEKDAVKATIDSTKSMINTLKEYRDSLMLGSQSPLTPEQAYQEAARQLNKAAAIAQGGASTDAEIAARNDAINKLPALTSSFLDASRVVFASGAQYTADFNSVLALIDSTSSSLVVQQSTAEKQLDAIDSGNTILGLIQDATESTSSLLEQYLAAVTNTAAAKAASDAAGNIVPTTQVPTAIASATVYRGADAASSYVIGTTGTVISFEELKKQIIDAVGSDTSPARAKMLYDAFIRNGVSSSLVAEVMGKSQSSVLDWANSYGFPAFANGGIAHGLSIVGEQGPELVNFATPSRVYSNRASNDMFNNKELIAEIKELRKEVNQLRKEQNTQTGDLITSNYDANTRAAKTVAEATELVAKQAEWIKRSAAKVA